MAKLGLRIAAFFVAALAAAMAPALAQREELKVIAVVNDDVISYYDLVQRVRFGLMAARIQDTQENRQRLAWQVLQAMVNEKLQLQEAKRNGVTVRDNEVEETVGRIERNNNWPAGQFRAFLAANGIPASTALEQLRAQIAWNKVVLRKLRPLVQVSPADVDEALARMRQNIGKPEYRVAEIFLPIDKADQEGEVRRNAERIIQQIRAGAPFPALAQQFSQAPSAGNGGDLGWIQQGQLDPALDAALGRLQARETSEPIRSYSGIHILYLLERRIFRADGGGDETIQYVQVTIPIEANAKPDDVTARMNAARQVAGRATKCADLPAAVNTIKGATTSNGNGTIEQVPADIRGDVASLKVNQISQPIRTRDGARLVMVCSRGTASADGMPSRENITALITQQRLEQLARRLLRDLRQQAIIEIRNN